MAIDSPNMPKSSAVDPNSSKSASSSAYKIPDLPTRPLMHSPILLPPPPRPATARSTHQSAPTQDGPSRHRSRGVEVDGRVNTSSVAEAEVLTNGTDGYLHRERLQDLPTSTLMAYAERYKLHLDVEQLLRKEVLATLCAKNEWVPTLSPDTYERAGPSQPQPRPGSTPGTYEDPYGSHAAPSHAGPSTTYRPYEVEHTYYQPSSVQRDLPTFNYQYLVSGPDVRYHEPPGNGWMPLTVSDPDSDNLPALIFDNPGFEHDITLPPPNIFPTRPWFRPHIASLGTYEQSVASSYDGLSRSSQAASARTFEFEGALDRALAEQRERERTLRRVCGRDVGERVWRDVGRGMRGEEVNYAEEEDSEDDGADGAEEEETRQSPQEEEPNLERDGFAFSGDDNESSAKDKGKGKARAIPIHRAIEREPSFSIPSEAASSSTSRATNTNKDDRSRDRRRKSAYSQPLPYLSAEDVLELQRIKKTGNMAALARALDAHSARSSSSRDSTPDLGRSGKSSPASAVRGRTEQGEDVGEGSSGSKRKRARRDEEEEDWLPECASGEDADVERESMQDEEVEDSASEGRSSPPPSKGKGKSRQSKRRRVEAHETEEQENEQPQEEVDDNDIDEAEDNADDVAHTVPPPPAHIVPPANAGTTSAPYPPSTTATLPPAPAPAHPNPPAQPAIFNFVPPPPPANAQLPPPVHPSQTLRRRETLLCMSPTTNTVFTTHWREQDEREAKKALEMNEKNGDAVFLRGMKQLINQRDAINKAGGIDKRDGDITYEELKRRLGVDSDGEDMDYDDVDDRGEGSSGANAAPDHWDFTMGSADSGGERGSKRKRDADEEEEEGDDAADADEEGEEKKMDARKGKGKGRAGASSKTAGAGKGKGRKRAKRS